ncbi:hypothetical protein O988_07117 [Pseudogymnoascus sp. VKM F-3808]|nr:hypothetical protein O988_07117 [Pseudogymnoascus sp. VKM F-3808]
MAPSERGWRMIIIVAVLVGLATIATVLRIVARLKRRVKIEMDDYLCFIALFLLYGMFVQLVLWCAIGGNGTHFSELSPETLIIFGKIFIANQFTYFALCPAIKISIICFYRRIFPAPGFHRITYFINWLIGLWAAAIFITCGLQCRPLRGYWDKSVDAKCIDGNTYFIVNQTFNVVMDFVILGLPLPIIWRLKRVWQDKLALSFVFALGGFVCFASVYRIVVLFYIDPGDTTYTVYQATLWTHIEPSVGMICACLPTIRGLITIKSWRARTLGSKDAAGYSTGSKSHNTRRKSGSQMGNSVYIKMNDRSVEGGIEREEKHMGMDEEELRDGKITVRTDIKIYIED